MKTQFLLFDALANVIKKNMLVLTLILIIFSIYSGFIYVSFSLVDDRWMLLENKLTQQFDFSWQFIYNVFSQYNDIQYSPLNTLYYSLIYKIDGYNPFYFHLGSILIHIINSILVFSIAKLFLSEHKIITVYLFTLFWAIHPLNVEAVVWISASKILLFSSFSLLAIKIVLNRRDRGFFSILKVFVLLLLACLSKEQAILTVFVIILLDVVYHKKYSIKYYQIIEYVFYLTLFVGFVYISLTINLETMKRVEYSLLERITLSFYAIFWYIANSFFPYDLHYHYPFPINPGMKIPIYFYAFVAFWLYIIFLIAKNRIYRNISFYYILCAFFLLSLCLHIIPMWRSSFVSDRYMYMPLLFILLPVFERFENRKYFQPALSFYILYFSLYSLYLTYNWVNLNIS